MVRLALKVFALYGVLVAATLQAARPLTSASIRMEIRNSGAKAVVERLYTSHIYENVVMRRIREGSVPWIMLAPALSQGTDGATSEELGEALIYALPKAPAAVLSVIDLSGSSVPRKPSTVCSASFYEGDQTNPQRYRAVAIQAVEHVTDRSLMVAKRQCLAELNKG